jgi:hypothetical protein
MSSQPNNYNNQSSNANSTGSGFHPPKNDQNPYNSGSNFAGNQAGFQPQANQFATNPNSFSSIPDNSQPSQIPFDAGFGSAVSSGDGFQNNTQIPQPDPNFNYQTNQYPQDSYSQQNYHQDPSLNYQGYNNTQIPQPDPNFNYQTNQYPQDGYSQQNYPQDPSLNYQGYPVDPNIPANDNFYPAANQGFAPVNNIQTPPNTFNQPKSNNLLIIISIAIVVVLLIVSGVLFWVISNNSKENTPGVARSGTETATFQKSSSTSSSVESSANNTQSSQNTSESSSESSNATNETPAELAVVYNVKEVPKTWLSQMFFSNGLDNDGNCLNNSICGNNADPDNDGLSNLEEYNYQLDPLNNDYDKDGIADGDEIYAYLSHPREKFSSSDTQNDSQRLLVCLDPINKNSTKMVKSRLENIAGNIALKPLRNPTLKTLKDAGATNDDIKNGYMATICGVSSTSNSSKTSTNTR